MNTTMMNPYNTTNRDYSKHGKLYIKGCPVFSFTGNTLVFSHNLQILRSFLGRECFKHASQQAISSMKQHIQNACKLTWGLATAWPPLIVAQPGEFREELHDREFQYWDRSNQSLKLYYTHLRHNLLMIHILGKQSGMEKGLPEISHVEPLKSCYLIPSSLKLGKHP